MTAQHFLPACHIGQFSLETSGRLRKRSIWVQRVGRDPYPASAEYVGHSRRIYDRETPDPLGGPTIDDSWKYEGRLPEATTALNDRTQLLNGHIWAEVLVPFISSLFIRGVEFVERYQTRIPGITGPPTDKSAEPIIQSYHDNTIAGRMIEWQRILAPVMSAKWTMLHGTGAPILITSDIGYCVRRERGQSGVVLSYAFPITPSSVLILERRTIRRILDWNGDQWIAPIEHRDTTDEDLLGCRRAIQDASVREVYGPSRETVAFPASDFQPRVPVIGPGLLFPNLQRPRALLPYVEDYFKVLTLLEASPAEMTERTEPIDWEIVSRSWAGIAQILLNMPRFPGGLAFSPFSTYLDLERFTIEDVDASIGSDGRDMSFSTVPRPALLQMMENDLRSIGIDPAQLLSTPSDQSP